MDDFAKELESFQRQMAEVAIDMTAKAVPMSIVVPFIQSEMQAWDNWTAAALRADPSAGHREIALWADGMLEERRKRFNLAVIQARIIETVREREPQTLCGKLIKDRGVCGREVDHKGGCKP